VHRRRKVSRKPSEVAFVRRDHAGSSFCGDDDNVGVYNV